MVGRSKGTPRPDTPDPKSVMVIYGRNEEAKASLFAFLRSLSLSPFEWDALIDSTDNRAPNVGEALENGFAKAKAAVVLFTPDDTAHLRQDLWTDKDGPEEKQPKGQPPYKVLFVAGIAFARHPDRTILVALGDVRTMSDIHGVPIIHLSDEPSSREALAERLRNAGCSVQTLRTNWLSAGTFRLNPMPLPPTITENGNVRLAYMTSLDFAKTVHHLFQELQQHGLGKIDYASRTLFMSQSQGNDPKLIKECESGWADTEESRNSIQKEVISKNRKRTQAVRSAYALLWTTEHYAAPIIATSFASFQAVEESIIKYKSTIPSLATRFDKKTGALLADQMIYFLQDMIVLSIAVERLIRESDSAIKNLINAFQSDSRVSPEQ